MSFHVLRPGARQVAANSEILLRGEVHGLSLRGRHKFAVFPWTRKSIFLGVAQLWLVSCRIVFRFGAGCERIETTCFSLSLSPLVTAMKLALAPGSPWWSTMPRATGDGGLNNWYERSLIKHLAFQGSRHCSSTARAGSPSPPIGHLED